MRNLRNPMFQEFAEDQPKLMKWRGGLPETIYFCNVPIFPPGLQCSAQILCNIVERAENQRFHVSPWNVVRFLGKDILPC